MSLNPEQFYYHGTGRPLRGEHLEPGRKPTFPSDTEHGYAYATADESTAWSYAERAYQWQDAPYPRVYRVQPTGPVEPDPSHDEHGQSRNVSSGDIRSRHPFRIVDEVPMPDHMGVPDDWR